MRRSALLLVGVSFLGGSFLPLRAEDAPQAAPVPDWAKVSKEQSAEAERLKIPVAFENSIGMRFVLIPAGAFLMGSPADEPGRGEDEGQHKVTLTKPFYMSIHETTNGQWLKFEKSLPSLPKYAGEARPVNYISAVTAKRFLEWLEKQEPDRSYALPTEAQWEYACRAGTKTAFSTGAEITRLQANFGDKKGTTVNVGSFPPNPWGLHDMHGNVLEWCSTLYGAYPGDDATDPTGPTSAKEVALRGGSWVHEGKHVRSAARHQDIPNDEYHAAGFRLVVLPPE